MSSEASRRLPRKMKHIETLINKAREQNKIMAGEDAAFETLCVAVQNLSAEPFRQARMKMAETFKEDADFKNTYVASISMLIYDHLGKQVSVDTCDELAIRIMNRIFED